MSDLTTNNTESPPVKISKGLSTYAGLAGAGVAVLPVVVDLLSSTDINEQTKRLLIIVAGALLAVVILCRTAQSVAAELSRNRKPTIGMQVTPNAIAEVAKTDAFGNLIKRGSER